MFAFILFLAVIVIFIWAKNRFYVLEQRLEGLERKLKELRAVPQPAQGAVPVKPAPPAPMPAETLPAIKPSVVPLQPPTTEVPPAPIAEASPVEASPPLTPHRHEAPPATPPFIPPPAPLLPSSNLFEI